MKAAAVADYRLRSRRDRRSRKAALDDHARAHGGHPGPAGEGETGQVLVGFAAETENLLENARQSSRQEPDLVVANDVTRGCSGRFGQRAHPRETQDDAADRTMGRSPADLDLALETRRTRGDQTHESGTAVIIGRPVPENRRCSTRRRAEGVDRYPSPRPRATASSGSSTSGARLSSSTPRGPQARFPDEPADAANGLRGDRGSTCVTHGRQRHPLRSGENFVLEMVKFGRPRLPATQQDSIATAAPARHGALRAGGAGDHPDLRGRGENLDLLRQDSNTCPRGSRGTTETWSPTGRSASWPGNSSGKTA